ncbi:MAG: hypothetical protein J6N45_04735 [Alphaproteobacteria bacterium]|nr:hypothetical protein [Alphaproteobacteria bacterium]
MNKIYFGIIAFLAAVAAFYYFADKHKQNKIDRLESQIIALKSDVQKNKQETTECRNEISKHNAAQTRAGKTIEKVRTVVHTIKSDCDCYHSVLPDELRRPTRGEN